ncbi:hypothetical protein [Phenylobacterium sp. J367]|uniref:hypothetical protein n=1 Tax=Phenylobacterium sp. J367 TaxID=2898435 RepID=UPI002151FD85|nr:hypothetical protein [Phenylobacterium sp. J367]MCR5877750.1 hypothetical protein [Phenylobacterium sp. J367]
MLRLPASLLILALAAAPAAAQPYKAPRTPFGHPDLQGIWTNTAITFLQRPPNFKTLELGEDEVAAFEAGFKKMVEPLVGTAPIDPNLPAPPEVKEVANADFIEMRLAAARIDGKARSSWIVEPADGRIPFTEAGKALTRELSRGRGFDSYEYRPTDERCLTAIGSPEGPPMMNSGFNGHYRIVQTRDHVAIEIEMNHDVRIIRLTDAGRPAEAVRSWLGDSVGRWEGETLVVETTNLRPQGYIYTMGGGFAYGPKARVIERFTRTGPDSILYDFSVEDPDNFGAWRAEMPWRPAEGPIYEYACHEGNYSMENILAGARVQETAATKPATAPAPPR